MGQNFARCQPRQEVVSLFPYAPSLRWYSVWLDLLRKGEGEKEAVAVTNRLLDVRRAFARCSIAGNGSPLILSIPLEGGSRMLRNPLMASRMRISEHGNWRRVHLGAIEAAYGKFPFFEHIVPLLKTLYSGDIYDLCEFTGAFHQALMSLLWPENVSVSDIDSLIDDAIKERARELGLFVNPDLSVLDVFMRYGPETFIIISVSETFVN